MNRLAISLITAAVILSFFLILACGEKEQEEKEYPNCRPGLEFLYDCGYNVSFDDIEPATIGEAWESCQTAYGRMWRDFIHCWRRIDTCEQFAQCLPDHGFNTSLDQVDDDDDDDDDDIVDDDDDIADDDDDQT